MPLSCEQTLVVPLLTRVELERFTAFTHLNLDVSPGINILMGARRWPGSYQAVLRSSCTP